MTQPEVYEMRSAYVETLIDLAKSDNHLVVLEADLMRATGTGAFKERYPERTFNIGVAEANMVGIAAGLALEYKRPWAATFACFASRRAYDQFFLSACYAKLPVHLVGTDPGITAEYNGGTHMPFEDIALMRCIPNVVVCEPSDPVSLRQLIKYLHITEGPTYLRLHRKPAPILYGNEHIALGHANFLRDDGDDIAIIAAGVVMVNEALKAHESLKKQGIKTFVVDMHTIKPLDIGTIDKLVRAGVKLFVTCENHQITGGLGSAVCEHIAEYHPGIQVKRVGVRNKFGQVGPLPYLQETYQLTAQYIENVIKGVLQK